MRRANEKHCQYKLQLLTVKKSIVSLVRGITVVRYSFISVRGITKIKQEASEGAKERMKSN